jgi:hypothetical protein
MLSQKGRFRDGSGSYHVTNVESRVTPAEVVVGDDREMARWCWPRPAKVSALIIAILHGGSIALTLYHYLPRDEGA